MRQIFDDFRAALWHDFRRFLWCVRTAILAALCAWALALILSSARFLYLKLSTPKCDCRSSWEKMTEEEKQERVNSLRELMGIGFSSSIASSSSADDQKPETQDGGSTTAPETKTP